VLAGGSDPVAALGFAAIRAGDDALEGAAILLDGFDRSDVVIVAGHEDALEAELLVRNLELLAEHRGGKALPPVLRNHHVANVPAHTLEILVERMTDRNAADDAGSGERKQER